MKAYRNVKHLTYVKMRRERATELEAAEEAKRAGTIFRPKTFTMSEHADVYDAGRICDIRCWKNRKVKKQYMRHFRRETF